MNQPQTTAAGIPAAAGAPALPGPVHAGSPAVMPVSGDGVYLPKDAFFSLLAMNRPGAQAQVPQYAAGTNVYHQSPPYHEAPATGPGGCNGNFATNAMYQAPFPRTQDGVDYRGNAYGPHFPYVPAGTNGPPRGGYGFVSPTSYENPHYRGVYGSLSPRPGDAWFPGYRDTNADHAPVPSARPMTRRAVDRGEYRDEDPEFSRKRHPEADDDRHDHRYGNDDISFPGDADYPHRPPAKKRPRTTSAYSQEQQQPQRRQQSRSRSNVAEDDDPVPMDTIDYGELTQTLRELKRDLALIRSMNASTQRVAQNEPTAAAKTDDSAEIAQPLKASATASIAGNGSVMDDASHRSAAKPESREAMLSGGPAASGSSTEARLPPSIDAKLQMPVLSRAPLTVPSGQGIVVNAACDPTVVASRPPEPVTILDVNRKMFVAALNKLEA
ncbi:B80.5 [miniopterid betaherpesvirus 1]|nr:B80.5 [miniopterid betaherpesvirus 1]AFK83919.1 B80.5 [miniopterid betaherpesvirus 1]